jgi:hypothetical protein
MSQPELLKLGVRVLEDAGIEYMLTGSLVSSLQGEPRSTHDADIVVSIEHSAVKDLVSALITTCLKMPFATLCAIKACSTLSK